MIVKRLEPISWALYSEKAHLACFSERRPPEMERISYALVAEVDGIPAAYVTVKELDSETAYFQHGGAFPNIRGTTRSLKAYRAIMDSIASRYMRAGTLIENTNKAMLKFAMNEGWTIMGLRVFEGSILLEHKIDFSGEPK